MKNKLTSNMKNNLNVLVLFLIINIAIVVTLSIDGFRENLTKMLMFVGGEIVAILLLNGLK